jgi:hypothetical protein
MWTAGRRHGHPDHYLVRPRRVRNSDLERLMVGAKGEVMDVLQGDVERGSDAASFFG